MTAQRRPSDALVPGSYSSDHAVAREQHLAAEAVLATSAAANGVSAHRDTGYDKAQNVRKAYRPELIETNPKHLMITNHPGQRCTWTYFTRVNLDGSAWIEDDISAWEWKSLASKLEDLDASPDLQPQCTHVYDDKHNPMPQSALTVATQTPTSLDDAR